jgi:hypothetical protein
MFDKLIELVMTNPKMAKPMVSELVDQYKPLLYGVCEEVFNIYKDYANNTEYFNTVATCKKNQYDAYVNADFTPEQAFNLILNDNKKLEERLNKLSSSANKSKNK